MCEKRKIVFSSDFIRAHNQEFGDVIVADLSYFSYKIYFIYFLARFLFAYGQDPEK